MISLFVTRINLMVERLLPECLWNPLLHAKYRLFGRHSNQTETAKAAIRRTTEGFFNTYCTGHGIDIGYGGDLICQNARGWDIEHGDAQQMVGVPDSSYEFVYASHTLEHMHDPSVALSNWWRILKPEGYLILYVPDRDLYEKRKKLPSRFNPDHKHYFTLTREDLPDTIHLLSLVENTLSGYEIIYSKICCDGYIENGPECQSQGEYSIEVVIKKLRCKISI